MHLMQLLDPMRWRNLCYCLRMVWRAVLLSRNTNNCTGKIQNLRLSNRKSRKINQKIDIGIYHHVNKNFQFDYIVMLVKKSTYREAVKWQYFGIVVIVRNNNTCVFLDDVTRVILMGSANGDYINANYVNMEIPGSGIINRYIATQGPLSSTVADFWQMVLEAGSTLVVMLTTLVERGRAKCHQYWPAYNETLTLRNLTLTSTAENVEDTFIFREFILRDVNVSKISCYCIQFIFPSGQMYIKNNMYLLI